MNISSPRPLSKTLIAITVAAAMLTACASAPVKPDGAAAARNKLIQLQSNPQLADRAPVAIKDLSITQISEGQQAGSR
jgi:hypothetical protein